jgi:hypothetical protein
MPSIPSTADAIRVFCQGEPEIEAAYVCLVERTREGDEPERALRLSVTLTEAAGDFDGRRDGAASGCSLGTSLRSNGTA